jgi:hypothetical protein
MERDPSEARRVAVVVVHGVADQRPGETARSVVELLVASAPATTAYEAKATDSFILSVEPLRPAVESARQSPPTPNGEARPFFKAVVQSARSDFQRPGWEAPATVAAARSQANVAAPTLEVPADRGLAATNYLLGKYIENGAATEAFDSTCIELERSAGGSRERVDVYEMYWADLSRLSGAIPRIVTELFTMVFRLSKLGRETVDEARLQLRGADGKAPASWRWLAGTQIALDWAFVNGLAALFAQLGLLGLVIVGLGFAALSERGVGRAVGVVALVFGALWFAYRRRDALQRWLVPLGLIAAAIAMLAVRASAPWIVAALFLALLTLGYNAALRIADDRFPLTRVVGLAFWAAVLALMLGAAVWRVSLLHEPASLVTWVQAALFGTEAVLYGIKIWWILAAPLFIAWLVSGVFAARHGGYSGTGSVGTGRIGFFVSLGAFVMLTMATWALVSTLPSLPRLAHGTARLSRRWWALSLRIRLRRPSSFSLPATKTAPRSSRSSRRCCCCWWPTSSPSSCPASSPS